LAQVRPAGDGVARDCLDIFRDDVVNGAVRVAVKAERDDGRFAYSQAVALGDAEHTTDAVEVGAFRVGDKPGLLVPMPVLLGAPVESWPIWTSVSSSIMARSLFVSSGALRRVRKVMSLRMNDRGRWLYRSLCWKLTGGQSGLFCCAHSLLRMPEYRPMANQLAMACSGESG
jgi:hypothetical protein